MTQSSASKTRLAGTDAWACAIMGRVSSSFQTNFDTQLGSLRNKMRKVESQLCRAFTSQRIATCAGNSRAFRDRVATGCSCGTGHATTTGGSKVRRSTACVVRQAGQRTQRNQCLALSAQPIVGETSIGMRLACRAFHAAMRRPAVPRLRAWRPLPSRRLRRAALCRCTVRWCSVRPNLDADFGLAEGAEHASGDRSDNRGSGGLAHGSGSPFHFDRQQSLNRSDASSL